MLKIILIVTLISVLLTNSYSQLKPESFYISGNENYFAKILSSNPKSNSILDIITIGDTVWLGTSRGVSVSFDRGENWNNFYSTAAFGTDL